MTNLSNFKFMRKCHNVIKFNLVKKAVDVYKRENNIKFIKLFDTSVGRFGDMHSYMKSKIDRIVGIDPDDLSIKEGNDRLESTYPDHDTELLVDTISNSFIKITEFFDIVVSNFTLHYFFENSIKLENAIRNVSRRLKSGGYFIGTSIDGNSIHTIDTPYYKIEENITNPEDNFGNSYTFELKDKTNSGNYFSEKVSIQTEYKVNRETFKEVCKNNGLEFVSFCNFKDFPSIDRTNFSEHEHFVHNMYFTFIFYKT